MRSRWLALLAAVLFLTISGTAFAQAQGKSTSEGQQTAQTEKGKAKKKTAKKKAAKKGKKAQKESATPEKK